MIGARLVLGRSGVPIDAYDAIELLSQRADHPSRLLAERARRVADLWNDPPLSSMQTEQVHEVYPELADALDELLDGGPISPRITWADVRPEGWR
jgi:hypothetical protein